jgi:acyl carrier protein
VAVEIDPSLNPEKVARVNKIIGTQLGIAADDIKPEDYFVENYGADSLDLVELSMALEDEFEQEIPDTTVENWTQVKQAYEYLAKL